MLPILQGTKRALHPMELERLKSRFRSSILQPRNSGISPQRFPSLMSFVAGIAPWRHGDMAAWRHSTVYTLDVISETPRYDGTICFPTRLIVELSQPLVVIVSGGLDFLFWQG